MNILGLIGRCGDREVFTGFAKAGELVALSFADVLDEASGKGYQRRFSREHSLEFKRYIQQPGATSTALTFNLRQGVGNWSIERHANGSATLKIDPDTGPALVQVDGQHRLGFLQQSTIEFAFMTFINMSIEEEMEVFRTINGKAKGLQGSLLDYTEARLIGADLAEASPELYVALQLNEVQSSPWFMRMDLGGDRTMGTKRVASLRTMKVAVKRFIKAAYDDTHPSADTVAATVMDFWRAVAFVLKDQWAAPRNHVLTKGIGVYALMSLAGALVREASAQHQRADFDCFVSKLSDFVYRIDWSNSGPLHGFGGVAGADAALQMLLQVRADVPNKYHAHA